jgi:hypothetical protein
MTNGSEMTRCSTVTGADRPDLGGRRRLLITGTKPEGGGANQQDRRAHLAPFAILAFRLVQVVFRLVRASPIRICAQSHILRLEHEARQASGDVLNLAPIRRCGHRQEGPACGRASAAHLLTIQPNCLSVRYIGAFIGMVDAHRYDRPHFFR